MVGDTRKTSGFRCLVLRLVLRIAQNLICLQNAKYLAETIVFERKIKR